MNEKQARAIKWMLAGLYQVAVAERLRVFGDWLATAAWIAGAIVFTVGFLMYEKP